MRKHHLITVAGAILASATFSQVARADLLILVDKSTQRMTVAENGQVLYDWPVSTGKDGYRTPDGQFRPMRMDIDHRSDEWDDAPMPYSIFFTNTGVAVHGTNEQRELGRPVSHGCVRLSVQNAATLWNLVERETMQRTTVVVSGSAGDRIGQVIADNAPMVLTPPAAIGPSGAPVDNGRRRGGLFALFGQ